MQYSKGNVDANILKKFLEDKGSSEDTKCVRNWFLNGESDNDLKEQSLHFWDETSLNPDIKDYNGAHILDQIHHKINIDEKVLMHNPDKKSLFVNYLIKIAAIFFIPLLVATIYLLLQNNLLKSSNSYAEIYAPYGTRTTFHLPDGSTGWINGGSSLEFPVQFNKKSRNVSLTGEAYFNVSSDHKKPFIVSTKNIDVKVYGTSFNIMAYNDESLTEVTLKKGKIELFRKKDNGIKSIGILSPDQKCIYNEKTDSSQILSVNSSEKLTWVEGKLTFKYEPFGKVIRMINRWYNVDIVIKDEVLDSYVYYGTFKDETLDEVLKMLEFTAPIRYRYLERERRLDGTFDKRKVEIYYCKKPDKPNY